MCAFPSVSLDILAHRKKKGGRIANESVPSEPGNTSTERGRDSTGMKGWIGMVKEWIPIIVGFQALVGFAWLIMYLVGGAMWSSREIPETSLTLLPISLDPFEDRKTGGVEGPGGLRDLLAVGEEEVNYRSAKQLWVLGVSDTLVVRLMGRHGNTSSCH